jgi:hypothetical protein
MIGLLVLLLVLVVVFWIVKRAGEYFGAPPIVVELAGIILALVFILACLRAVGVVVPYLQ